MLVLCALLVSGAFWGWRQLTAPLAEETTTAGPTNECTVRKVRSGKRVKSTQVQVSVFNAGTRGGLADTTLARFTERGFVAGETGNAPVRLDVERAQVNARRSDDAAARLVARQFGPRVRVQVSRRDLGPGVDVVVGNAFRGLASAPPAVRLDRSQRLCLVPAR